MYHFVCIHSVIKACRDMCLHGKMYFTTLLLFTGSRVRETVIEVEYPLVESQLKELDEQLEKAIHQLNWTSEGSLAHYVHIV